MKTLLPISPPAQAVLRSRWLCFCRVRAAARRRRFRRLRRPRPPRQPERRHRRPAAGRRRFTVEPSTHRTRPIRRAALECHRRRRCRDQQWHRHRACHGTRRSPRRNDDLQADRQRPRGDATATATVTVTAPAPPPPPRTLHHQPKGTLESRVQSDLRDALSITIRTTFATTRARR